MASMSSVGQDERCVLAVGWAGSPVDSESGDLHVVAPFQGGTLVAMIDGLGHGPAAAAAARAAASVLEACPSQSVLILVQRCHDALRKTRGAVMSLASFRTADSSVTWLGIGNVDGVLIHGNGRPDEAISVRSGVVGFQLPTLRASTVSVSPGDTLIMATDGIRHGFTDDLPIAHSPQELAESILARFARRSDDAHVVVARYLEGPS
jgi:serine phosphatase RsbU (regulator of sigma subunit)